MFIVIRMVGAIAAFALGIRLVTLVANYLDEQIQRQTATSRANYITLAAGVVESVDENVTRMLGIAEKQEGEKPSKEFWDFIDRVDQATTKDAELYVLTRQRISELHAWRKRIGVMQSQYNQSEN